MRITVIIFLLIIARASFAQDEFYRNIDWKFIPDSVVVVAQDTYSVRAVPYDYNDPSAIQREIGNYVVDFVGHRYKVIDYTTTTLIVFDEYSTGQAPQTGQIARCYQSVNGGEYPYVGSVDYSPLDMSARWRLNGADNELMYRHGVEYDYPFKRLVLDNSYSINGNEIPYTIYADTTNRTISVELGNGVVMQVNQETLIQVHNGSGATIMDGRILGAIGGANDRVSVSYADKGNRYDALIMSTEIIQADSIGLACEIAGRVNGVNTGAIPVGKIFLDTLGLITADPGEFPDYNYPLGAVVKTGVTDGIIQFRSDGANFRNDVRNAFDGAVRETFDFRTFSDGVNVYGVLTNQDAPDSTLTLMFSDDWHDFTVPDTIMLTPGTATNPQQSWVYIDKETRTLQSSTGGFPSTEHAEIAKLTLLSAARTQADGALRNQNTNNHLKYANNNGHIVHMGDRIRVLNAQWEDGVALTVSGTPTNLYLATTSGHVWQMHKQSFEAHDMAAGDDIHIVNDFTTPYTTTTNLNTVTTYSDGSTWNNEWQNLVLWGVANKTGEVSHIMLNLASDGYLTEDDAIEKGEFANYTIPRAFRGVGFLIARITVRRAPGGYTFNPSTGYLDLRGYYPNNTAGGGTGSSGLTEFTQLDDTPSSYIGFGDSALFVTSAEDGVEFRQIQQSDVKDLVSDISALQAESHPAVTLTTDDATILSQNEPTQELSFVSSNLPKLNAASNTFTGKILYDDGSIGGTMPILSDNPNNVIGTGFTSINSGQLNAPTSGNYNLITMSYASTRSSQLALGIFDPNLWFRHNSGTWSSWYKIWHDGNFTDNSTEWDENTLARHNAVTIGAGNGLSLSTQQLSLGLSSTSTTGALSSTDWNTFNNKISDKTVTFTGGTNVTIGGTYPNFTITDNSGISNLTLGETSTTAYRGDRGKIAYDYSQIGHLPLTGGSLTSSLDGIKTIPLTLINSFLTAGTSVGVRFSPTTSPTIRYSEIIGYQEGGNAIGLSFITGLGSSITEKMYIRGSGNVGIGYGVSDSQTSTYKLSVSGDAYYAGSVTIPADPYDATWDDLQEAAPKDAVYDKIESMIVAAPATASSTGTAGQIAYDTSYIYICIATNTWKRVAISSW